jgi:hypothetical protein
MGRRVHRVRVRFAWAIVLLAVANACGDGTDAASDRTGTSASTATPALATQAPVAETPVAQNPDPGALAELLSMVPSSRPPPTAADGGTLVGSDSGKTAGEDEPAPSVSARRGRIKAGVPVFQPDLSSPAIERTAREQIYWKLNEKCRGADGKSLPPDSITLVFTIRTDGTVDPASVAASADDEIHEAAAECVLREFSASPFRGPSATLLTSVRVIITWPSAD